MTEKEIKNSLEMAQQLYFTLKAGEDPVFRVGVTA